MRELNPHCVIAGGGPAGLMTGYLLARQGVSVVVLEKHADFFRDFRGDTVHPSTLELFHELGMLEKLLARPHEETEQLSVTISGRDYKVVDFTKLSTKCKFIAMMPQWDFLDCVASEARKLQGFQLLQSTMAEDLIIEDDVIVGVKARDKEGTFDIRADLTIAADGRSSTLRAASELEIEDVGAPIDVFWMKLARPETAQTESFGRVSTEGFMIQINRGDYWQCALPFEKGAADTIRAKGLEAFRQRISAISPTLSDAVQELTDWDQVKLLTVQVNHLKKWWRDGLLCIGDAAHAMSPVGGIGINLAIQDAVATARLLGPHLHDGTINPKHLAVVQKRRAWPARMTQRAQIAAHNTILVPALNAVTAVRPPIVVKILNKTPFLRGFAARAVGLGLKPEHWDKR